MGTFLYGLPAVIYPVDDRALLHLELTILAKLRRDETFTLTLERDGVGREALWMAPGIPMRFAFTEGLTPPINRAWLQAQAIASNSNGGLRLVDEPPDDAAASDFHSPRVESTARLGFGPRAHAPGAAGGEGRAAARTR